MGESWDGPSPGKLQGGIPCLTGLGMVPDVVVSIWLRGAVVSISSAPPRKISFSTKNASKVAVSGPGTPPNRSGSKFRF